MSEYINKQAKVWRSDVEPTNKSFIWVVTESVADAADKTNDTKVWNGTAWVSISADVDALNTLLNELNGGGTYPAAYQTITDNNLTTVSKQIVGAINELDLDIESAESVLTEINGTGTFDNAYQKKTDTNLTTTSTTIVGGINENKTSIDSINTTLGEINTILNSLNGEEL